MARIRTVKPELWTDPEFTECSLSARLLFIALLNFASDFGVLPDKPRQLKMQCLPADSIDVDPLIGELIEQEFLVRRVAPNGDKVLVIRTFTEHQKINRATLGRWGDPSKWGDDSLNDPPPDGTDSSTPHGDISESHPPEGKGTGREGKGKEVPRRDTYVTPSTARGQHGLDSVIHDLTERWTA